MRWGDVWRWLRVVSWLALVGATGVLVRAEARRSALPEGVVEYTDLAYGPVAERRARLDVYVPAGPAPAGGRPTAIAIHGGGWRGGSKTGFGRMAARLAQHGYVVVAVNYTLSRPGAPSWPRNRDDVREAVRWVRRHADAYGIDPERIVAVGASAGGHLAALLGTCPDARPEAVSSRVQAVVDFYGPTDLDRLARDRPATAGAIALLLGGGPDAVPDRYAVASPVRHVTPDDPPMFLVHGSDDLEVPPSQSEALAAALAGAGVPHRLVMVAGARHGFDFQVDDHRDLLPEILAFLQNVWKVQSGTPHP